LQGRSNIARPNAPSGAVFKLDEVALVVRRDLHDPSGSSFWLDTRIAAWVPGGGITGVLPPAIGGTEMPGSMPAGGIVTLLGLSAGICRS